MHCEFLLRLIPSFSENFSSGCSLISPWISHQSGPTWFLNFSSGWSSIFSLNLSPPYLCEFLLRWFSHVPRISPQAGPQCSVNFSSGWSSVFSLNYPRMVPPFLCDFLLRLFSYLFVSLRLVLPFLCEFFFKSFLPFLAKYLLVLFLNIIANFSSGCSPFSVNVSSVLRLFFPFLCELLLRLFLPFLCEFLLRLFHLFLD